MCGILGILHSRLPAEALGLFPGCLAAMQHRGPDDEGIVWLEAATGAAARFSGQGYTRVNHPALASTNVATKAGCLLGHRRLSIVDLSPAGHQPMSAADGKLWIVYNGEVYNYRELREELASKGHVFYTQSDTEVLLAAFLEWGTAAFARFVGMFAACLVDLREAGRAKAVLVRDFFGIKPLYFHRGDDGWFFASEIKALLPFGGRWTVHPGRLHDFLRYGQTDESPQTLVAEIEQLPAAHFLEISLEPGKVAAGSPQRYWQVPQAETRDISAGEAAAKFRELFLTSINLHLRSDVPLGTALSGGLDSSSIIAAIRHLRPDATLHTFSFVDKTKGIDEESYMDIAGRAAGAIMHKVSGTGAELAADLEDLVRTQDLPFGSTSVYAQYRVMKLAGEAGIKVMLDGQGADELLGGYHGFFVAKLRSLVASGNLARVWKYLQSLQALGARGATLKSYLTALLPPALRSRLQARRATQGGGSWLSAGWFQDRGVEFHAARPDRKMKLVEALAFSLTARSLPDFLRYEDRDSMRFSIESRVPFLTPQLVEFVYQLPHHLIITDNGRTKNLLREGLRGIVPDAILDRPDKIGFATPEKKWLKDILPWVERELEAVLALPFFNADAGRGLLKQLRGENQSLDWSLWRCLSFSAWLRHTGAALPS